MLNIKSYQFKIFYILLLFALGLVVTYIMTDRYVYSQKTLDVLLANANKHATKKEKRFTKFLSQSTDTLYAIRHNQIFMQYLTNPNKKNNVDNLFLSIANTQKNIMQLRFLDKEGQEKIRIDRSDKGSKAYLNEKFQDKSTRYYFTNSKTTQLEKVWYSSLDLNIEFGMIETPYKPTIRAMLPISQNGKFIGVLIINYFMHDFLEELVQSSEYNITLIDNDGYILKSYNNQYDWNRYSSSSQFANTLIEEKNNILHNDFFQGKDFISKRLELPFTQKLFLIVKLNKTLLDSRLTDENERYLIVSVIILLLAIFISYLVNRVVNRLGLNLIKTNSLKRFFETIFNNAAVGIVQKEIDGDWIQANNRFLNMLGYSFNELKRLDLVDIIHPDDYVQEIEFVKQLVNGSVNSVYFKKRYLKKDNTYVWADSNLSYYIEPYTKRESIITVVNDLSEIFKNQKKLDELLYYNQLTHLPNKLNLIKNFDNKLFDESYYVLFIDIDNFKRINETYSYKVGDHIIYKVAKRVKKIAHDGQLFYHISGNKFVLIIENMQLNYFLSELQKLFEKPIKLDSDNALFVTVSIGIANYPDDADNIEEILKLAETAMYSAKKDGKNNFKFYNDIMSQETRERTALEVDLKNGILNDEFEMYYQPQINIETNECIGFEALIRWNQPQRGFVQPDSFIPLAEETKLIIPLGEVIIKKVFKNIKYWTDNNIFNGRVAINISGIQFKEPTFLNHFIALMEEYNVNPNNIEIEITESILVSEEGIIVNILNELSTFGVSVSLDDFGTGYSSLSYLRKLPINILKIDKSFVTDIPIQNDAKAITDTIINMSKKLGFKTIAEGVEDIEQLEFLKVNHCDFIQGYYISKPMSFDNVELWLKEYNNSNT